MVKGKTVLVWYDFFLWMKKMSQKVLRYRIVARFRKFLGDVQYLSCSFISNYSPVKTCSHDLHGKQTRYSVEQAYLI